MSNTNQILIRAKDIALLLTIISLLTAFVKMANKPAEWDHDTARLDKIEPIIENHTTRLAVEDDRWNQVFEQLKTINHKLDRR